VYPAEVPPYHPWAPGQSNTQLHCALDGLRQGELWICMQLKLFAEAVEEDMRARAELLEDHAHKIYTLEGLLRSAGQTIELLVSRDGQLIDMRDSLLDSNRALANQVAELQKQAIRTTGQINELMRDSLAMKRELESRSPRFRNQLCDELACLASRLRAPTSLAEQITAAQHIAWQTRGSPAPSVASRSRQASPAPSVVAFGQ
jgi:small-conductance mechanosensitive channel